jgi:UTP:GlnB (protein PII) uridylyltransferase
VYQIARSLTRCGVGIDYAKVATEKSHALDVFYIRDARGFRLSEDQMREVESALLDDLGNG